MPLTQPERDNPLMRRYFQEINLPGKQLAKRCGVSHSQIYMARTRNVGAGNAEKISRGVRRILGLSEEERLELKAEIMGHPGEYVRAYFGDAHKVIRLLDVPELTAAEILDEEKVITHKSGIRALEKLRKIRAPAFVIESIDRRLMPPPEPRRGLITQKYYGQEWKEKLVDAKKRRKTGKPKTHEAIERSGLMLKEIHERAGVGKETMRRALYERVGHRSASAIADVLGEAAGLSREEIWAMEEELLADPHKES